MASAVEVGHTSDKGTPPNAVSGPELAPLPAAAYAATVAQAALSIADLILLNGTLHALPGILQAGQGIFNRLLDVLKLTLTHATTAVLLTLVALVSGARYFPYLPAHNVAVTLITITLPAIGLAYWLGPGKVRTQSLSRRLAFSILPAGISVALLALGAHLLVQRWGGGWFRRLSGMAEMETMRIPPV